jgi:[ribosomal protein S5]-alanine N-acetyltransferase
MTSAINLTAKLATSRPARPTLETMPPQLRGVSFETMRNVRVIPGITLRQLTVRELEAVVANLPLGPSFGHVHHGALPPPRVNERALAAISTGKPVHWWAPLLVVEQGTQSVVGGCAFKGAPREGAVEILYGIAKECRGRGIASAAVAELAKHAFESGALEVLAEIEPHNIASARVVQKCGFVRTGESVASDGVLVDQWKLAN